MISIFSPTDLLDLIGAYSKVDVFQGRKVAERDKCDFASDEYHWRLRDRALYLAALDRPFPNDLMLLQGFRLRYSSTPFHAFVPLGQFVDHWTEIKKS